MMKWFIKNRLHSAAWRGYRLLDKVFRRSHCSRWYCKLRSTLFTSIIVPLDPGRPGKGSVTCANPDEA